jgi:hypothetical protein
VEWLSGYIAEGASHLVLRFAGEPEPQMETLARLRSQLG